LSGVSYTGKVAGESSNYVVTILDIYNNQCDNYAGKLNFSSNDSQVVFSPSSYQFTSGYGGADSGYHSFAGGVTLKTAGSNLYVRGTHTGDAQGNIVNGSYGEQTGIVVPPAGLDNFYISIPTAPLTSGSITDISVEARDSYNNIKTNWAGLLLFEAGDGSASYTPGNTYQFTSDYSGADNGKKKFDGRITLQSAGTYYIRVSADTKEGKVSNIRVVGKPVVSITMPQVGVSYYSGMTNISGTANVEHSSATLTAVFIEISSGTGGSKIYYDGSGWE